MSVPFAVQTAGKGENGVPVYSKKTGYVVDVSATPPPRLTELPGFKKIEEFEMHCSFFDNDGLSLYHQNILRTDGRQVIILKWRDSLRAGLVSACHRIHHEKYTNMDSKRKKVLLEPRDMGLFLKGLYIPSRESSPAEISRKAQRLHEVIDEMHLHPQLHVVFKRSVYNNGDNSGEDHTLIIVDENIRGFRETGEWADMMESDGQPFGTAVNYPFAVIKVCSTSEDSKSAAKIGHFIEGRLNGRCASISKFQYGCFTVLRENCHLMPRWYKYLCNEYLQNPPEVNTDISLPSLPSAFASGADSSIHHPGSFHPVHGGASASPTDLFHMLKPRVRVRKKLGPVDFKAFLCLERTTFQWLNFMAVYSMFAIGLLYKGGQSTQAKLLVITVLCDIIIAYALVQHHRRRIYFVNSNKERGFLTARRWNEKYGLTIFSVVVTSAITAYLVYLIVADV